MELSKAQNRSCRTLQRVGKRLEVAPGLLHLLAVGIAAEGGQVDLVDHVALRAARDCCRGGLDAVGQEAAGLAREGFLHQLAVHHHEGLGNRPLEARRLLALVVGEGEEELAEPLVALPVAAVAAAGLMGLRRGEQRVEELLGRHRLELHVAEERPLPSRPPFVLDAAELVGPAGHDPADQLLDVVAAVLEFLGRACRAARDGSAGCAGRSRRPG